MPPEREEERKLGGLAAHLQPYCARTGTTYLIALAIVAVALASLPLVRVGVAVAAPGVVRPTVEKHEVRSAVTGRAERIVLRRGDRVEAGDTLVVLGAAVLRERVERIATSAAEVRRTITDLRTLIASDPADRPDLDLATERLRREHLHFVQEMGELRSRLGRAGEEFERTRVMVTAGVLPAADLEERAYQLRQSESGVELAVRRARARWQAEVAERLDEAARLELALREAREEETLYAILAPIGGTVEEVLPLSPGSPVRGGDVIAVISPDAPLEVELFVSTRDIGLVSPGMPVRILVDAFDFRHWGFLPATVSHVGDDFVLTERIPTFRVTAIPESTHVALSSGVRGELRKGMTVTGRVMVAERSLLQLIRDDVASWIDPRETRRVKPLSTVGALP